MLLSLTAVALFAVAACSDDDKEAMEPLAPIFEKPLTLQCNAGATEKVEFASAAEWSIASDAIWCTLSVDGVTFANDIAGGAGEATVFVKVGNEAQEFAESVATLTMMRRGNKETIAKVHRTAMGYSLRVVDANGEECSEIAVSSTGVLEFSVEANFDFGVSEKPQWIDEFTVNTDKEDAYRRSFRITVADEYEAVPCKDVLKFFNGDGTAQFDYMLSYSGMSPERIRIEGENPWGWNLSADGAIFSVLNKISGDSLQYEGAVPYKVTTLNYDCRYLCFNEGEDSALELMEQPNSWLKVNVDSDDASKVSISGEPFPAETEGERKGYVVALPAVTYDSIMALYESLHDVSFIDSVYNNVMIEVTQVSDYVDLTKGFTVMKGMTTELDCFEESDPAMLAMLDEKYSLDKVYAVSADAGSYLQIFPHLSERHWEGWSEDATIIIDADGSVISPTDVNLEAGMDANDNMYISVKALSKPIIVILRGVNGEYLKALVIKSGITLDPGKGFRVFYMMLNSVPCALETDMELAASIIEQFGTKEIYRVESRVGRILQVFPNLSESEWDGGNEKSIKIIDFEGNDIPLKDINYEVAMNDQDELYANFKVKKNPYIAIFCAPDGKAIKALVVAPQS